MGVHICVRCGELNSLNSALIERTRGKPPSLASCMAASVAALGVSKSPAERVLTNYAISVACIAVAKGTIALKSGPPSALTRSSS